MTVSVQKLISSARD